MIAGLIAIAVVLVVGINLAGNIDLTPDPNTGVPVGFNAIIAVIGVALIVGLIAYAATEYAQTGRLDSITSQFDTRTIVLIPIAIAINIILGQTVAAALKMPIYLDSIGTILVGVLAGPIAGALTGGLANLIWTYVLPPPFHSAVCGAVLHRGRRDRAPRRDLRPARLLPEPPEHPAGTGSRSAPSWSS